MSTGLLSSMRNANYDNSGYNTARQTMEHWQHEVHEPAGVGGGAAWERLQQEAGLGLRLKDQERDLPGIQEQGEVFKTEPGEISKLDFLNV